MTLRSMRVLTAAHTYARPSFPFGRGPCFTTPSSSRMPRSLYLRDGLAIPNMRTIKELQCSPSLLAPGTASVKSASQNLGHCATALTCFSLAYAEMRLILAKLIWNFDIDLDSRSEGWLGKNTAFLLWEKPELWVRLTPRSDI